MVKIVVDLREKRSAVVAALTELGAELVFTKAPTDYILSARCGLEFKSVRDFVNSIVDGRLLEQLAMLKEHFARPLLLIEGTESFYRVREVHPNSIRGALAAIAIDFGIPMIRTASPEESAALLLTIATREQEKIRKAIALHPRKPLTGRRLKEYIVAALPAIGPSRAASLLKRFGSVAAVFSASEKELREVEGIGPVTAKRIREVLDAPY